MWGNEEAYLSNSFRPSPSKHIQQFTETIQCIKEAYSSCSALTPTRTFLLKQWWKREEEEYDDEWDTDRKAEGTVGGN